jgi:prepilin-type N-terminal cleavage/methylation domain-containing protein
MKKTHSGFAAIELLVVVVIVAAVVAVGYYVAKNHDQSTPSLATTTSSSQSASSLPATPTAPQITTAADLKIAMRDLNNASVSSNNTYSTQLATQSQGF